MMTRVAMMFLASAILLSGACTTSSGPYAPAREADRDTARAEKLSRQAADLIWSDPIKAESLLREALSADLYYGPAHNNLGVIYLEQGKLYEAASEFEWARKLMPGHPDPRLNLGLALERGGRIDDAIQSYESALTLAPEHLDTIQSLVRCQLRYGRPDQRTAERLAMIRMRGDAKWSSWAATQNNH
jgi:Tfp pilus assembly protein PilF